MSYDLTVYTRETVGADELGALICAVPGLGVEPSGEGSVMVVRGARWSYSFTVDGPDLLEPEDVPAEVLACVLSPRYLWSVAVEGSSAAEVPHAVRFARRMAQTLDGAVVDLQKDEVWSRSRSRAIVRPARGERISEVSFDWFCLRERLTPNPASLYVDTVTRHLPEALPRRFGQYEPFQGKLDDVGADGFQRAWEEADSLLFFAGSAPVIGGHLSAGPSAAWPDKFWSMSLTLQAAPLSDPAWRDVLKCIFTTLADNLPAFFATAQVTRGNLWFGRSSFSDRDTEGVLIPVRYRIGWTGLPPIPMWWTWLGTPFAQYTGSLPKNRTTRTTTGLMFENSGAPLPRDELDSLDTWLPNDLFASLAPNPDGSSPVPLAPAMWIPPELR